MSSDILNDIDQALSDYEVSGDAMRWTPRPSPALILPAMTDEQRERMTSTLAQLGESFRLFGATMRTASVAVTKLGRELQADAEGRGQ